ncbi:MAG: biotin--[acetyl-CoA-carboxylase] ligase [Hyphomicrobiales bacterium]
MTSESAIERKHYSSVGSTNDLALEAFRAGRTKALWITADEQIGGKGRRGRNWVSPVGNFYGSLLLVNPASADCLPQLAFVISLALHRAISIALPPTVQNELTVKWPNDLLFSRKKVSGILLEAVQHEGRTGIVIGCGVNCIVSPVDTPYPVANFAAEGYQISADALFELLNSELSACLKQWQRGANFLAIREAWLSRASGVGENIVVRLTNEELHGKFVGLDDEGRLLLSRPGNGTSVISAGDVFMLPQ